MSIFSKCENVKQNLFFFSTRVFIIDLQVKEVNIFWKGASKKVIILPKG